MGTETERQGLVDFLYRDLSRIDSFFAQLFHGNLREVEASSSLSSTSSSELTGDAVIIKGGFAGQETTASGLVKRSEPHDQKIVDLLGALGISCLRTPLADTKNGQIVLIRGQIAIRDYQTIKDAIPVAVSLGSWGSASKQERKEREKEADTLERMLRLVPMGPELEVRTPTDEIAVGAIKREYLAEAPENLLRVYGTCIPGEWFVLGIIDSIASQRPHINPSKLRQSIDDYARIIKDLYGQATLRHAISPILIYREVFS